MVHFRGLALSISRFAEAASSILRFGIQGPIEGLAAIT